MKNLKYLSLALLSFALVLTACDKDEEEQVTIPDVTLPSEQGSNDETVREEYDNAVDDIFNALENSGISTGRKSSNGVILPCGVIRIDSSGGSYKFVYDSTKNCQTRVLSGSITASLVSGSTWADQGAVMNLLFTNYKVLFTTNNQTLEFNGTLSVTNQSGGKVWQVLNVGGNKTIVHTISGTINITFDNNANDVRAWTISKKRTYESTDGQWTGIRWTLEADGNNAEIGTAKDGTPFVTTIPTPIVWENCGTGFEGPFVAKTGELRYTNQSNYMSAEAGYKYDTGSQSAVFVGDCDSEGYKLTFFINGQSQTSFQFY